MSDLRIPLRAVGGAGPAVTSASRGCRQRRI